MLPYRARPHRANPSGRRTMRNGSSSFRPDPAARRRIDVAGTDLQAQLEALQLQMRFAKTAARRRLLMGEIQRVRAELASSGACA